MKIRTGVLKKIEYREHPRPDEFKATDGYTRIHAKLGKLCFRNRMLHASDGLYVPIGASEDTIDICWQLLNVITGEVVGQGALINPLFLEEHFDREFIENQWNWIKLNTKLQDFSKDTVMDYMGPSDDYYEYVEIEPEYGITTGGKGYYIINGPNADYKTLDEWSTVLCSEGKSIPVPYQDRGKKYTLDKVIDLFKT